MFCIRVPMAGIALARQTRPMLLGLEHRYAALPSRFHALLPPTPVAAPRLLVFNAPLADFLGIPSPHDEASRTRMAAALSGNALPADARPLAMAYAGHQYAHFVPQLGDGRALLLGEKRAADGQWYDIQLKGSGRTPFSRGGDGRAAVGPMLREYLISEAMHALGIPTTRSLAVVATGEQVLRDGALPGAVLTRTAASHLRIGTFEYFAAREDLGALQVLLDFAIGRHDPDLAGTEERALAFLQRVVDRQARLVAQWLGVGFIHGVMNTDNMTISGETIDYGPCAFMDHFDPGTVFSSIDHRGRYAWGKQAAIAQWNLARLAETLLPLIPGDKDHAIRRATQVIEGFAPRHAAARREVFGRKLGLPNATPEDGALMDQLLSLMHAAHADFTLTFRSLAEAIDDERATLAERLLTPGSDAQSISAWFVAWRSRLAAGGRDADAVRDAMQTVNPAFIPRNHQVERALDAASERGDLAPFGTLLQVLQHPFVEQPAQADLAMPPRDDERVAATFCGT